jgi:hypothetical protein
MMTMKPRACETVALRSLNSRFAKVGTIRHATPQEADLLISLGMAERAEAPPVQKAEYLHREMRATGSRSKGK